MAAKVDGERADAFARQARRDLFPVAARFLEHVHEDDRRRGTGRGRVQRPCERHAVVGTERRTLGLRDLRRHAGKRRAERDERDETPRESRPAERDSTHFLG